MKLFLFCPHPRFHRFPFNLVLINVSSTYTYIHMSQHTLIEKSCRFVFIRRAGGLWAPKFDSVPPGTPQGTLVVPQGPLRSNSRNPQAPQGPPQTPRDPPGTPRGPPRDPQGPQGTPRGSPKPLETTKGHPRNPPGALLAAQLSGQSVPGEFIDYAVGFWDPPTSPGVGLVA